MTHPSSGTISFAAGDRRFQIGKSLTERDSPGSSQHEKTDEHDRGILNQTEAATDPVTDDTDKNLSDDDTDDFEVLDRLNPGFVADSRVVAPASREGAGK
jgi:hypothetical protein